ncbi:MAG TPA: polyprenyl synthetase family protein, partial [Gammaproteobacteria bacterium]|nr:polyprenyl synthetase family protein [Gammaproteobacteria bacterium]
AFNYQGNDHITLASATELIHTASLLHDDVVDASTLRRGRKTANEIWGNAASVLVGDFLYSRAFELTVSLNDHAITQAIASATHQVAQGEIMQLMHRRNFQTTIADYLQIITGKTGKLFEVAAHLGALLSEPSYSVAACVYGLNVGIAFQIMDDMLDYQGNVEQIGKNIGDDLQEGNLTLPLLFILQSNHAAHIECVKNAIHSPDPSKIIALQQAIIESGACAYAEHIAKQYAHHARVALENFPKNIYTEALEAIIDFAVHRNF